MKAIISRERWFYFVNNIFMLLLAVICVLPLIHVVSISLSSSTAVMSNQVTFWPIDLSFSAYEKVLADTRLLGSLWVSVQRTFLSLTLGLLVNCMTAYVLSKEGGRDGIAGYKAFVAFFIVAMLFNGGLIPTYLVVTKIGLYNSIWALVLPTLVSVVHIVLIMNFFKALPKELEEAAFIDGANHWQVFYKLFLQLSLPVLATVGLFTIVYDWNEWLAGTIYMKTDHLPLSSFLKSIIAVPMVDGNNAADIAKLNSRSINSAQILIGALPILLIYPLLQRFLMNGIVIGAVKE
ncbi:Inner membrane ABC transporter permease protein YcjP [compost metagenome]